MRKVGVLLLAGTLLFSLTACQEDVKEQENTQQEVTQETTTVTPEDVEKVIREDYGINSKLPGKAVLDKALRLIEDTLKLSDPISFYKRVNELCDDFIETGLDIGDLNSFLGGVQKEKFLHAVLTLGVYESSKNYISGSIIKTFSVKPAERELVRTGKALSRRDCNGPVP